MQPPSQAEPPAAPRPRPPLRPQRLSTTAAAAGRAMAMYLAPAAVLAFPFHSPPPPAISGAAAALAARPPHGSRRRPAVAAQARSGRCVLRAECSAQSPAFALAERPSLPELRQHWLPHRQSGGCHLCLRWWRCQGVRQLERFAIDRLRPLDFAR